MAADETTNGLTGPVGAAALPAPPDRGDGLERPPRLPQRAPEDPGLNAVSLREEGIQHLQRLAGKTWTDHNLHDPGITILEVLSFALTDLAYRTTHPLQDLLAWPREEDVGKDSPISPTGQEPERRGFFTAAEILPCNPVTVKDYRKLIIDCDGVKNAWLAPANSTKHKFAIGRDPVNQTLRFEPPEIDEETIEELTLRGLYVVYLELEQDIALGDLNDSRIPWEIWVEPLTDELDAFLPTDLRIELEFLNWMDEEGVHEIDSADFSPTSVEWRILNRADPESIEELTRVDVENRELTWAIFFGKQDANGPVRWVTDPAFPKHTELQVYVDVTGRWRFRVEYDDGNIVAKSTYDYSTDTAAMTALRRLMPLGSDPENYRVELSERAERKSFFAILDRDFPNRDLLAVGTDEYEPNSGELEVALNRIVGFFRQYGDPVESAPIAVLRDGDFRVHLFQDAEEQWRYRLVRHNLDQPDRTDIVLTSARDYPTRQAAKEGIDELFGIGTGREAYRIDGPRRSVYRFRIEAPATDDARKYNLAIGTDPYRSKRAVDARIAELRAYFRKANASESAGGEGSLNFRLAPREAAPDFPRMTAAIENLLRDGGKFTLPKEWVSTYLEKIRKRQQIVKSVLAQLHAHRNLCEDFIFIRGMEVEEIAVCADLQVAPGANVERIMAEMIFQIDRYLAPDIAFYSLEEMLARSEDTDAIFNGPLLRHGFIDDEALDLPKRRTIIYGSDVINIMMDLDGVKAVTEFQLANFIDGERQSEWERWKLPIASAEEGSTRVPRLSIPKSPIRFYVGVVPYPPDQTLVEAHLDELRSRHGQPKLKESKWDIQIPKGAYRDLSDYTSIQSHFPLNYGMGHGDLGNEAPPLRRAQAKQLRAYLTFFDQIMADYLALLDQAKVLLAVRTRPGQSRIAQSLTERKEYRDLLNEPGDGGNQDSWHDREDTHARRIHENALLDHLLARMGEDLSDYSTVLSAVRGETALDELIEDKARFLAHVPELGHDRGRGFDYRDSERLATKGNVSGLKKRVRWLVDAAFAKHSELQIYVDANGRWRFQVEFDNGDIIAKSTQDYPSDTAALTAVHQLIRLGGDPANYSIGLSERREPLEFFRIVDRSMPEPNVIAVGTDEFERGSGALRRVQERLVKRFRRYSDRVDTAPIGVLLDGTFRFHVFQDAREKWRFRLVRHDVTRPERTDIVLRSAGTYPSREAAEADIDTLIALGSDKRRHRTRFTDTSSGRKFHFNVEREPIAGAPVTNLAIGTDRYKTRKERDTRIEELRTYFDRGEFHILEHILLRPIDAASQLMSVQFDKSCSAESQWDPYSFRISVILPYWPGRFRNVEFRRFIERTLHLEAPAHVSLKICWINREQMQALEDAYRNWLALHAQEPPKDVARYIARYNMALGQLLNVLESLKSVYPVATLHDCRIPGGPNPVVLGHTQLGQFHAPERPE